jgi:NADH-quinone oxidoreductase subunit J
MDFMILENALQFATTLIGIGFALYIVLQPHPVLAAYSLIALAIMTAIKWWLYDAGFFALILLLIYMGAVLVLFLFVVMTLSQESQEPIEKISLKNGIGYFFFSMITIRYYVKQIYSPIAIHTGLPIHSVQNLSVIIFKDSTMLLQWIGLFLLLTMLVAMILLLAPLSIKKEE